MVCQADIRSIKAKYVADRFNAISLAFKECEVQRLRAEDMHRVKHQSIGIGQCQYVGSHN